MVNERIVQLAAWVAKALSTIHGTTIHTRNLKIATLAGDASFRRYFRVILTTKVRSVTYVLVDAPPPESLEPFVSIALAYSEAGVRVPKVLASNAKLGAMLQEDFGDQLFFAAAEQSANALELYDAAIQSLPAIMQVKAHRQGTLPLYDRALLERENSLFRDWLLSTHLQLSLSSTEERVWQNFSEALIQNALLQPQVGVHRDYHSRNLMVLGASEEALGVIDFQDAVVGPITYDVVSLLRDCYRVLPAEQLHALRNTAYQLCLQEQLLPASISAEQWQRWFDLMGLQRHTKAAGIFARLYHRDGKAGYLADIPTTVAYLQNVAGQYAEFAEYQQLLTDKILPAIAAQNVES
ncbi:MAG: phosphotransferase [Idiomarina sp.]|nr:phosphotransferase [Idiomarina sp.]